jgi:WhiB family redox-sensing transcriptional regulator
MTTTMTMTKSPMATFNLPTLMPAFPAELVPAFTDVPCVGQTELYFPSSTLHWTVRNAAVEEAKALCATCRHAVECLAMALARDEPDGVWGGELLRDGRVIPAYPRPGRPAKARPEAEPAAA